ncbi:MAG TPA: hypothetical protein VGM51_14800 [Armatimonadota bacterium]|jgi:hypothetical protein
MRYTLFALMALLSLTVLPTVAKAAGVSGKYYLYTTTNGVSKVHRDLYLDFQTNGRCASRTLKADAGGSRRYNTVVVSYEVSGNYVEVAGEFGFAAYEIKGDRLISESGSYVKASVADQKPAAKRPAPKPARHVARKR